VLSLHAAEACPIGAYKVIDFMGANAATVGEAFGYAARYFPLINTAIRLPIDDTGDPVTFDIVDETGPQACPGPTRSTASRRSSCTCAVTPGWSSRSAR
jgi:hypothetical protein